ncbi:recombinase-like helix-turn-helix domain-containing protein [Rhodococcus sp. APC 3903]|uniref:recombinase-like helix-turn-helix domain-containing protein n=1 Tax=Rhodococcus sp. APC 3903 TaxID=3035193 RepID=UPI0033B9230A
MSWICRRSSDEPRPCEHQSRLTNLMQHQKLAETIEEFFAGDADDLEPKVAGSNHLGIPSPNGPLWTAETVTREM